MMNEVNIAIQTAADAIGGGLSSLSQALAGFSKNYGERTVAYDRRTAVLEKLAAQGKKVNAED